MLTVGRLSKVITSYVNQLPAEQKAIVQKKATELLKKTQVALENIQYKKETYMGEGKSLVEKSLSILAGPEHTTGGFYIPYKPGTTAPKSIDELGSQFITLAEFLEAIMRTYEGGEQLRKASHLTHQAKKLEKEASDIEKAPGIGSKHVILHKLLSELSKDVDVPLPEGPDPELAKKLDDNAALLERQAEKMEAAAARQSPKPQRYSDEEAEAVRTLTKQYQKTKEEQLAQAQVLRLLASSKRLLAAKMREEGSLDLTLGSASIATVGTVLAIKLAYVIADLDGAIHLADEVTSILGSAAGAGGGILSLLGASFNVKALVDINKKTKKIKKNKEYQKEYEQQLHREVEALKSKQAASREKKATAETEISEEEIAKEMESLSDAELNLFINDLQAEVNQYAANLSAEMTLEEKNKTIEAFLDRKLETSRDINRFMDYAMRKMSRAKTEHTVSLGKNIGMAAAAIGTAAVVLSGGYAAPVAFGVGGSTLVAYLSARGVLAVKHHIARKNIKKRKLKKMTADQLGDYQTDKLLYKVIQQAEKEIDKSSKRTLKEIKAKKKTRISQPYLSEIVQHNISELALLDAMRKEMLVRTALYDNSDVMREFTIQKLSAEAREGINPKPLPSDAEGLMAITFTDVVVETLMTKKEQLKHSRTQYRDMLIQNPNLMAVAWYQTFKPRMSGNKKHFE